MAREMLFNIEDKLKNSPAQYSTFVCVFMNKRALGATDIYFPCVRRCGANSCEWSELSVPPAKDKHLRKSCVQHARRAATCACRSPSAPAGGSSSWPCTRPPSASSPPQCRSAWAGVCTCSPGSAPDAACSASPAPHSTAASPGWTCPSIWSLNTGTRRHTEDEGKSQRTTETTQAGRREHGISAVDLGIHRYCKSLSHFIIFPFFC